MRFVLYLCGFAWRDLTDAVAWRTTWVRALTVALVGGLTLALAGFLLGSERVRYARLREDPLSQCLFVGDAYEERLTPEVLAELRGRVGDAVGGRLVGVHAYSAVELRLRGVEGRARPVYGRTLSPEDPLLKSRPTEPGGRGFDGPDDQGVLLTPHGLEELGLAAAARPAEVILVGNGEVRVPVLGVLGKDVPGSPAFLILPRYERLLAGATPDPAMQVVTTTAVPKGWPALAEGLGGDEAAKDLRAKYPPAVADALLSRAWDQMPPVPEARDGATAWVVRSRRGGDVPGVPLPGLSEWNERLRRVAALMREAGFAGDDFRVDPRTLPADDAPPREASHFAAVYVADLRALRPAADACEQVRAGERALAVNRTVVEQVTAVARQTEQAAGLVALVVGVVLAVATTNLAVLQKLRAEQKAPEVAMLKAMGMTGPSLVLLHVVEGLMLWGPASALGVAIGALLQGAACLWWYRDAPAEAAAGFYWSPALAAAVTGGSLAVSLASGLWATRRARRASPGASLG